MLSVDCHTPPAMPTPPALESGRSGLPWRRLALSLAPDGGARPVVRRVRHASVPTVAIPPYSRIVFRAGAVSLR
jgi:hypothetical protein